MGLTSSVTGMSTTGSLTIGLTFSVTGMSITGSSTIGLTSSTTVFSVTVFLDFELFLVEEDFFEEVLFFLDLVFDDASFSIVSSGFSRVFLG